MSTAFYLHPKSGMLCRNKSFSEQDIKDLILESPKSYINHFSSFSFNLKILVTKREIVSMEELKSIEYDEKNCSFSYFKIIAGNLKNITKIQFKPQLCKAVVSLDQISTMDRKCLYKFQFLSPKLSNDHYTYRINHDDNHIVSSIFMINSTNDCLSLNLESGINKVSYLNKNEFTVFVEDNFGNSDSIECTVYGIRDCHDKSLVLSSNSREKTLNIIQGYDK